MGFRLPIPNVTGALGVEPPGLSWMELQNQSLGTLDGHNHTPGLGAQIPTAGININSDLAFGGFNATGLRTTRYTPQSLPLGGADIGCLLVSGVDLYYIDSLGRQVQITIGGGVAGTPGSISGLTSPASVAYNATTHVITFLQDATHFMSALAGGDVSIGDANTA